MKRRIKNLTVFSLVGFLIIVGFVYFTMGLYIIHPIGLVPDGRTVLYWRCGTDLPFIFSAKVMSYFHTRYTLAPRKAMALSTIKEIYKGRKIITLPYSKTLYLISTKMFICY